MLLKIANVFGPFLELDEGVEVEDVIGYQTKSGDVDTVMIKGEVVMKDRRVTQIDKSTMLEKLVTIASRPKSPQHRGLAQLMAYINPLQRRFGMTE